MILGRPRLGLTSRRSPARIALLAAMLGLALSAPAWAAPPAPADADAEQHAQAIQLYEEGSKAARLGQWDKARTFYLHAWNVHKHWQIAANLGLAEAKAGKHAAAAEHLSYFLREAPNVSPADRQKTQELIDQAKAKVGTLTVTVSPAGAEVRVDGAAVGTAPLKGEVFVDVKPGGHVVEARLEGYTPAQATKELQAGGKASVDLKLANEVWASPPAPAVILVGGAATAVAAVTGIVLTIGAEVKLLQRGDKPDSCKDAMACRQYDDAETARWGFAIAAGTSYILAAVLGAGTLTYALVKPSAKARSAARANLLLGPGVAGAMLSVSW